MHEIKKGLGFGTVKDLNGFSRFIVSNNCDCFLLYLIFNGNLVILYRINQLNRWYNILIGLKRLNSLKNFSLISVPKFIMTLIKLSLNNSWLSGFTDAEGCFSINIYKGKSKKKVLSM